MTEDRWNQLIDEISYPPLDNFTDKFRISSTTTKALAVGTVLSAVTAVKSLVDFQIGFANNVTDWVNGAEKVADANLGLSGTLALGFAVAAGYGAHKMKQSFRSDIADVVIKRLDGIQKQYAADKFEQYKAQKSQGSASTPNLK